MSGEVYNPSLPASTRSASCRALSCAMMRHFLLVFGFASVFADTPRPTLPPEERTNGKQTLAAVQKVSQPLLACAARIESMLGRPVCAATVVGLDGYILTKASEVPDLQKVRLKLQDGRQAELREIRREPRFDLVLAQAVGLTDLRTANFGPTRPLSQGQWLCSTTGAAWEARIGIVSANRRRIPGAGAALGVRMDEKVPKEVSGVRIIGVAADSPAEAAGLTENDVILSIADEPVAQFKRVHEIVNKRQPGEFVKVCYLREGKEETCRVRLASRTKVLQNWDGEDFANGGISLRNDNFPDVLQHDMPLSPTDMGGPLATLEGRVVGINIARVDRVTTLALPVESFWTEIQQWIHADRHPPKARPVP